MKTLFFALLLFCGFAHAHPSDYFNITAGYRFYMFWWWDDWMCRAGEVKDGDITGPSEPIGAIHFSETSLKNGIDCNIHFSYRNNPDYEFTLHISKEHCKPNAPCNASYRKFNDNPRGIHFYSFFTHPSFGEGNPAWLRLNGARHDDQYQIFEDSFK